MRFLFCLDNINDQLHAITENLKVLSEVKSKLQDNVVVSVEAGIIVDRSFQNTQLAYIVNTALKCLICHALMTSPTSVATCCKQVFDKKSPLFSKYNFIWRHFLVKLLKKYPFFEDYRYFPKFPDYILMGIKI